MKELSIEETARRYDEAIDKITDVVEAGTIEQGLAEWLFPELRESEDERIRKAIIEHFADSHSCMYPYKGFTREQILAWLKKQGEQKPADKVEPKFKVGDWITNGHCKCQITFIDSRYWYSETCVLGNVVDIDKTFHLWTIQDAKEGDVLKAHECLVLFKKLDGLNIKCYCTYHFMNNPSFYVDTLHNKDAFHPATKKQRDLLFQKMKEAGYEWDADKKELRNIEQNPAWSDEDNKLIDSVIELIDGGALDRGEKDYFIEKLKSLKDRVQLQLKAL